jgi:hypothetical protein
MKLQTRLYVACVLLLAAGIASSLLIYMTAEDESVHPAIQEMTTSKPYVRQIQRFGGKAAVLFDEFGRWFEGLWRGRALAGTVLWLSIAAGGVIFLVARRLDERD